MKKSDQLVDAGVPALFLMAPPRKVTSMKCRESFQKLPLKNSDRWECWESSQNLPLKTSDQLVDAGCAGI